MPKVTCKVMIGQINGQGGREVEVTYDVPIFAVFAPLRDLTAYELAQAHAVIGEYHTFWEEEWDALQSAQRHWKQCKRELGPGYVQHHVTEEG